MGIARLDFEKCDLIFEEVRRSWSQRWLSLQGETLAKRLGPPDGERADGDRYWLAVSRRGVCYELAVSTDGSFAQMSLSPEDCGLPSLPAPPPAARRGAPGGG